MWVQSEGGNDSTKLGLKSINWWRCVLLIWIGWLDQVWFGLIGFDFILIRFGLESRKGRKEVTLQKLLSLSASTAVMTKLLNGWTDHLSAVFSWLQMNELRILSITFCAQQLVLLSNLLLANIFSCHRLKNLNNFLGGLSVEVFLATKNSKNIFMPPI